MPPLTSSHSQKVRRNTPSPGGPRSRAGELGWVSRAVTSTQREQGEASHEDSGRERGAPACMDGTSGHPLTWSPFGPAAPPGPWQREGSALEEAQGPRGGWSTGAPGASPKCLRDARASQHAGCRGCLMGLFWVGCCLYYQRPCGQLAPVTLGWRPEWDRTCLGRCRLGSPREQRTLK